MLYLGGKSMRGLVAIAVAGLLAAAAVSSPQGTAQALSAEARPAANKPLTIATFNVRTSERGGPAWKPRRTRVLELMRRTKADVIVLQEADPIDPKPTNAGTIEYPGVAKFPALWLARKAGYEVVPRPDVAGSPTSYWPVGAQILYRPARLTMHNDTCARDQRPKQKIVTFTDRASNRPVRIVGMHLFPGPGQKAEQMRARSLTHYDRYARRCASAAFNAVPTVWLGDMNTARTKAGTLVGDELRSRGLRDSVKLARSRSFTQVNTFRPSRKVKRQGKRIDQIWVPTGTRVDRWTQIVDVKNGRYVGRAGSDHNPVVATVTLN